MTLINNLAHLVDSGPVRKPLKGRRITASAAETVADKQIQQLWQGQTLEALGLMTAGIAHDFGNLVTVIMGYGKLLDSHLNPSDPKRDLIAEIQKAGAQAERLTRQILSFAGPQSLEPQMLDLGEVLAGTEKMLRRLIGDEVFLSIKVPSRIWTVTMDPGQMQQIMVNLAVNARDAMPIGGTLTIEIANVVCERSTAPGSQIQPGNYVMLAIHDTGVGMSPATRAHIFEPFFTTKAPGKGTGLGLSMVDEIVRQNGGQIEVQSEVGRGSTFKVFLPQAKGSKSETQTKADTGPMPRGDEVILLVEDEEAVRHLVRQVLQMCGYKVLEAVDGKEAVKLAEKHTGPIHLLLSDVSMPNLGGCKLADIIRARHALLKVLFLSGHPIDYVYEQGARKSEFAFLQKPFTVGALADKVREVLNQQCDTMHD